MNIGIVGAGAIGLAFASQLTGANQVVVLARRSSVAERIARDGVLITTPPAKHEAATERRVEVAIATDPNALAACDAVIVAVKAYATGAALEPLRGVLRAGALVATVQNGVDNVATIRAALADARVVAGSTTQGAILVDDGRVRAVNRGVTVFARSDGDYPTSDDVVGALRASGLDAHAVANIEPLLWQKLAINAALNPLGALASRPNGEVVTDPDLAPLARALAAEAATVARAQGVELDEPWPAVEAAARATAANRNSMLQDIEAGRPTEIDAIAGAVVRYARGHGVPVPLNEVMLRLVRARERA